MDALSIGSYSNIWDVFLLFSIPFGGGIPAGVLLGQKLGLGWLIIILTYFASDFLLALYFEPLLKLVIHYSERFEFTRRLKEAMTLSTQKMIARFGADTGPLTLIAFSFGVDPMTGRAAAHASGYGFIAGWAVAIAGDMVFFTVIMASTIWLNGVLGDGTVTAIIIMVMMLCVSSLLQRLKNK